MPSIEWVVFDVGETLVDETRYWRQWGARLGLPEFTWLAILGGVIARNLDHRQAFRVVDPSFDLAAAIRQYDDEGAFGPGDCWWSTEDLYADVVPCLAELRAHGYRIGIAANNNQADRVALAEQLRGCGIEFDFAASSAAWDVWKPDPRFFRLLVEEAAAPPE
jgi:phosphoglycolate phosphatase-like HAD superfamily hydrolase